MKKWIQEASGKKGALHKQLGIPLDQAIPKATLHDVMNAKVGAKVHGHSVTALMKKRANFALNVQKRR